MLAKQNTICVFSILGLQFTVKQDEKELTKGRTVTGASMSATQHLCHPKRKVGW